MSIIPEGEFRDHGGPLKPRRPWWFTVILIILVLPGFLAPWFIARAEAATPAAADTMLPDLLRWLPAYLVAAAVCAWLCYPARRTLAWVLAALMLLSTLPLFLI